MQYERIYKKTQIGEKQFEIFSYIGKTKRQIGTVQTISTGESEKTYSVYIREEFDKASVQVWEGFITPNLKKFERVFYADLDFDLGIQAIQNFHDQTLKVFNGTDGVMEISDRIIEVSKMARNEKQKHLSNAKTN
jgi:hypothetical protein